MDCGIFNVRRDVIACDCTRLGVRTPSESLHCTLTERKTPYRTGESNLRQVVSYIPISHTYCRLVFNWSRLQNRYSNSQDQPMKTKMAAMQMKSNNLFIFNTAYALSHGKI